MNKLPTTINSGQALELESSNKANALISLPSKQPFHAKNIVISGDKLKMDVAIEGRLQTIQLSLKSAPAQPQQLEEAMVSVDESGKVITLKSNQAQAQLVLAKQLFELLAAVKGHSAAQPLQAIATANKHGLTIKQLDLSIPLPKAVMTMLAQEQKLIAQLSPSQHSFTLELFNQFKDPLFSTKLANSAIAKLIAQQLPTVDLKAGLKALDVKVNNTILNFTAARSNWPISSKWQPAKLQSNVNGIDLTKTAQNIKVIAQKPVSQLLQQLDSPPSAVKPNSTQATTRATLPYQTPLLEVTLQQIKSQVITALKSLINKPFGAPQQAQTQSLDVIGKELSLTRVQPLKTTSNVQSATKAQSLDTSSNVKSTTKAQSLNTTNTQQSTENVQIKSPVQTASLLPFGNEKVSLTQLKPQQPAIQQLFDSIRQIVSPKGAQQSHTQPQVASNESLRHAVASYLSHQAAKPSLQFQAPPIDFSTRLQGLTELLNTVSNHSPSKTNQSLQQLIKQLNSPMYIAGKTVAQTPQTHSQEVTKQAKPVAESLPQAVTFTTDKKQGVIESLLNLKPQPDKIETVAKPNTQVTAELLQKYQSADTLKQMPELNKLVQQAFTRMVDAQSSTAMAIKQQLDSQLGISAFTNTPSQLHQSSFSQLLERLLVVLLGSQTSASGAANTANESKVQALLETLLPQVKNISAKNVSELMQQPQARELLAELGQLQNQLQPSVSQLSSTPQSKQDSDAQLIINLLFPNKTPPEQQQTQLQIGHYNKPAKAGMPEKSVWFVRLCFDFAAQGQIHAQAELMDKAVECALIATSNSVKQMAEPHLAALRSKLASHGLQVAEIGLREEQSFQDKFFNEHAIINIKV
ncbi:MULTISPECIES: flagellar hook-length control protein FliK [unclassified Pseudoalteromonas]|uniref:flagellar hook-length control protein FliK n=1 Tax=unclassified Pseudoalteromonas TaxID=194690 RepID=UPI003014B1FD